MLVRRLAPVPRYGRPGTMPLAGTKVRKIGGPLKSHKVKNDTKWPAAVHRVGRLPVVATTPDEAVRELCRMAVNSETGGRHVHLVNAYTLALADTDRPYAALLSGESINLPDGKPLSIVSKLLRHTPQLSQIRGPQLFLDAFDTGRQFAVRHYLLGSSDEVLAKLQSELSRKFPGCQIVGVESPPYRSLSAVELAAQDARILAAEPHIVWIGLGTPKQDREASRLAKATGLTCVAVGAAFDFAAGTVREAPTWMRRLCLEWLFRLFSEPKRLWRRYVFGNMRFMKIVVRSLVDPRGGGSGGR